MQCELSDRTETKKITFGVADKTDRLDVLINNAARGIMTQKRESICIWLNHMGHIVLTGHLLPLLKKIASQENTVRIVNLALNAHESAPKDTKLESTEEPNKAHGLTAQYGRSKLAAILYSGCLARHLTSTHPNILANATSWYCGDETAASTSKSCILWVVMPCLREWRPSRRLSMRAL